MQGELGKLLKLENAQFGARARWQDPVLRRLGKIQLKANEALRLDVIEEGEAENMYELIEHVRQLYAELQSFEKYITRLNSID